MDIQPIQRPETPKLFDDYLQKPAKTAPFYPHHFRDHWEAVIEKRSNTGIDRTAVTSLLRDQNKRWNAPEKTLQNIDKIEDGNTLAVVTGQQAGLLGGPLYTFYKIITTIKLAADLQKKYPAKQFVPLFWLEVNDSDFAEISVVRYINKENALNSLQMEAAAEDDDKMIAARQLDAQIEGWRARFESDFFDSEFKTAAIAQFFEAYQAGQRIADAFANLLLSFFGKHGLVLLDPSEKALARLAGPLYEKALRNAADLLEAAKMRSAALDGAGYTPQIYFSDNQTLLFQSDESSRRMRVDIDENGDFQLKSANGYRHLSREQMLQAVAESPEQFSPNVALRPLVQDTLLPTVAYVGGPSEVAYFAQIAVLYQHFNIPMPVIYPRHRITIVESKIQKQIEKYNLDIAEILENNTDFIENVLRKSASQPLFEALKDTDRTIRTALSHLKQLLEAADPTLVNALEKTGDSIQGNFEKLSGKIVRSLEQSNETMVRQLERVQLYLLPDGNHQERVLTMLYFAIKYGTGFIDELLTQLPGNPASHYVIKL